MFLGPVLFKKDYFKKKAVFANRKYGFIIIKMTSVSPKTGIVITGGNKGFLNSNLGNNPTQ